MVVFNNCNTCITVFCVRVHPIHIIFLPQFDLFNNIIIINVFIIVLLKGKNKT